MIRFGREIIDLEALQITKFKEVTKRAEGTRRIVIDDSDCI